MKPKVTGIGGIFFVAHEPKKLKAWYEKHLGITGVFHWNQIDDHSPAFTMWDAMDVSSSMFKDTGKQYVYNYRVDDLARMKDQLSSAGISVQDATAENEFGRSISMLDLEKNKIVLWEASGIVPTTPASKLKRVTGIGGLFFKTNDVVALKDWYRVHLGFETTQWGCTFRWEDPKDPAAMVPARTEWSPFASSTTYFKPSEKDFMLNYRVHDLRSLLKALEAEGVQVTGAMEETAYGNFGWIVDPEENKIELWEPKDEGLEVMG